MGGAERATLVLAKAFHADIYTTTYNPQVVYPEFEILKVFNNPLSSLKLQWRGNILRSIQGGLVQTESVRKFRKTDLSHYDLVITIGQYAKHIPVYNPGRRIHYELSVKSNYRFEGLFKPWVMYMKKLDYEAIRQIRNLVGNSENTREQIKRFYQRDAEVIYPAVKIKMFRTGKAEDYFLAIERISPEKNIETQIEAFRRVPKQKLLIAGSPRQSHIPYFHELQDMAPPNVTFLGPVSDSELVDLYSHAKAAVQTHPNEDLGRIPIEAMASGKPCIAVNAGGFRETIIHGKTGILVDPPYAENLGQAIRDFKDADFNQEDCLARAQLFSEEIHIEKMNNFISRLGC